MLHFNAIGVESRMFESSYRGWIWNKAMLHDALFVCIQKRKRLISCQNYYEMNCNGKSQVLSLKTMPRKGHLNFSNQSYDLSRKYLKISFVLAEFRRGYHARSSQRHCGGRPHANKNLAKQLQGRTEINSRSLTEAHRDTNVKRQMYGLIDRQWEDSVR